MPGLPFLDLEMIHSFASPTQCHCKQNRQPIFPELKAALGTQLCFELPAAHAIISN